MKKYLSAALIAALVTGFVSSGALKATADVIERGFVSVSTSANTELPPDVAEISISVQTEDSKSLQKLRKRTNKSRTKYMQRWNL